MKLIRSIFSVVMIMTMPLFLLKTNLSAKFVNVIPQQLENCAILLQVDYSKTGTDWDIYRIQNIYPNSIENNGYLIFDKVFSNNNVPFDITVRFAIGENKQIFVGVLDAVPEAFWALVGTVDNHPWEDAFSRGMTDTDRQTIWDNGYKFAVEPSIKLSCLFYIQYIEHKSWIENNFISSPLSDVDAFLLPDARIKNSTGSPIVSIFASIRAKWQGFFYPFQAGIVDAWWPRGSANDTGTASWGFDMTVTNRSDSWLSDTFVYGDNGTTQTIYWDNKIKATHKNYGFNHKIENLNITPPISIKLEHQNVWSGNHNYLTMTFLADDVTISNIWESPSVGDTPVPQKILFLPGWNYEEGYPVNTPPVAICKDIEISVDDNCQANITPKDIDAGSYDPDDGDEITLSIDKTGPLSPGVYFIELTVTDTEGEFDTCMAAVTVRDTMPPNIISLTATPNTLWPPNHKMVPVILTVIASDNCDNSPTVKIIAIASNEDIGDTSPDWEITGELTANLRAERQGNGKGRIYTLTVQCTDSAGNVSTKDVIVTVHHNKKK